MSAVLDKAAERMAGRDRAMPKCPGLNAQQLTGEMSTGHHRLKANDKHRPFEATNAKRFGVRPSSGRVSDLYASSSAPGSDDGSGYMQEWREGGGTFQLPKAKTPKQDQLRAVCVAWIAGDRPDGAADLIKQCIATLQRTDPKHGSAWRTAMASAGLYRH